MNDFWTLWHIKITRRGISETIQLRRSYRKSMTRKIANVSFGQYNFIGKDFTACVIIEKLETRAQVEEFSGLPAQKASINWIVKSIEKHGGIRVGWN